jgi:hypothetical protein
LSISRAEQQREVARAFSPVGHVNGGRSRAKELMRGESWRWKLQMRLEFGERGSGFDDTQHGTVGRRHPIECIEAPRQT